MLSTRRRAYNPSGNGGDPMNTPHPPVASHRGSRVWNIAKLPLLITLTALAPLVESVCAGVCVAGIFASIVFEISAVGPRFPFVLMMGASLCFGLLIVVNRLVIALLSR